jgi:hypothetical protein
LKGISDRRQWVSILVAVVIGASMLASCGDPGPATTATVVTSAEPTAALSEATQVPRGDATEGDEPTPEGGEAAAATTQPGGEQTAPGTLVADTGFRPEVNGFPFENYTNDPPRTNMTTEDVQRMFGDAVCASTAGGCILTPAGQEWLENINAGMNGGHCEGFAALSLLLYTQKTAPDKFGAARAFEMQLDGNEALQREIAYYFATQATAPTQPNEIKGKTPTEILDILIEAYESPNPQETYTVGIYKPEFKGGHAMTPYAVESRGDGVFAILVYDNNYPGAARSLLVDRNTNVWTYTASTNPNEPEDEYRGDAETQTLTLTPTSPRLEKQACPFCAATGVSNTGNGKAQAQNPAYNQIWLEGEGDLVITDKEGRTTGYVGGKLVNNIPGVTIQVVKSSDLWKDDPEPVYHVPVGIEFSITADGTGLDEKSVSSVTMIGPGYVLAVEEINLDPGQKDTISFAPDGKTLGYTTEANESPDIVLGVETAAADYSFLVKGADIESGGTVILNLDGGRLNISTAANEDYGTYEFIMERIDDQGEQIFSHSDVNLEANDMVSVDYLSWQGNGSELSLLIDKGSDGTVDETITLTDAE